MNKKYVTYEEFGAVGDGVTDDFAAIKRAHDYANEMGLPVRARDGAKYYIHFNEENGEVTAAIVKCDVDWGNAEFIIDDRDISPVKGDETFKYSHTAIFEILPDTEAYVISDREAVSRLEGCGIKPGIKSVPLKLGYPAIIIPFSERNEDKIYRRRGYRDFLFLGQNRHEIILIDGEGNVSEETPIMFEYPHIDYIRVHRCDDKPITLSGGIFTTRASRVSVTREIGNGKLKEAGGYMSRGLYISRSNTTVKNVKHYVTDEVTLKEQIKNGEYTHVSSTYNGFYYATSANHVTFENCVMTGRRCYTALERCVDKGTQGTYDLAVNHVNKIVFKGCRQSNFWVKYDENFDITPAKEGEEGAVPSIMLQKIQGLDVKVIWGVGGTSFCKNMEYIDSELSRFDAHEGLYNAKIINSSINVMALTGVGEVIVENVKWYAADPIYIFNSVFHFRSDYGSTWRGTIKAKNIKAYFFDNENISLYYHAYGNWYNGYDCFMPNLELDGFEAFNQETREPLPAGTKIKLCGPSVIEEPSMHLSETKNEEEVFSYVDLDGDGFVDGTCVPYDKDNIQSGGIRIGSHRNLNVITPPEKISVKNLKGGVKISVPDTSVFTESEGGFFANTKFFYQDGEYYLGTNHKDTEIFEFSEHEPFLRMFN